MRSADTTRPRVHLGLAAALGLAAVLGLAAALGLAAVLGASRADAQPAGGGDEAALPARERRQAAALLADALDAAVRALPGKRAGVTALPPEPVAPGGMIEYQVPIDAGLLELDAAGLEYELTLRLIQQGFERAGYRMTRADAARAYQLRRWYLLTAPAVARAEVQAALARGAGTLPYRTAEGVNPTIAAWEKQAEAMRRAAAELRRRLGESRI